MTIAPSLSTEVTSIWSQVFYSVGLQILTGSDNVLMGAEEENLAFLTLFDFPFLLSRCCLPPELVRFSESLAERTSQEPPLPNSVIFLLLFLNSPASVGKSVLSNVQNMRRFN